tara:strand:- start:56 stop:679 length:624 start_codon:yes stop_codon:yes gene_type:complete
MRLFNFLRKTNDDFSQSGQDQFAYNISGLNGIYLEIGAHHPLLNSNTYNLELLCNWSGVSIENDKSFKTNWDLSDRKNEVVWCDAFNINYSLLVKQKNLSNRFNYLSCDIEPAENTFNILKKIINSGLSFDYISFENDKYKIGDKYEKLSVNFLNENNYKIAIKDVYSRNKKNKIFETWFVHKEVNFEEMKYDEWKKKFYSGDKFKL